ncbi:MAG: TrmB family transcriptional regulator [Halolamina sp.]
MRIDDPVDDAVELLQQLGLKEYEARCFVALSQLTAGTAKEVAAIADVPRTRVYDSVRVLEAQGLVEVQHTNPRRFRTVRVDEAVETLRVQYEGRIDRLTDALRRSRAGESELVSPTQEVWSLAGREAIWGRTERLIDDADDAVVVIVGDEGRLNEDLLGSLGALDDVAVVTGVPTEDARQRVREHAPQAHTYVSAFDWATSTVGDGVTVGTVLLADGARAMVSTVLPDGEERAVIGTGVHNGLVVLLRRLTGLVTDR